MIHQYCRFFLSNVGLKLIMATTGFLLAIFLLLHVLGNLTILVGVDLFNDYSYALTKNKALLYSAEVGLLGIFLLHLATAITLSIRNCRARPEKYKFRRNTGLSRRSLFSSNMLVSGIFVSFFLVVHLLDFRLGEAIIIDKDGVLMRDLASSVVSEFKNIGVVIFYVVSMIVLWTHLIHGFRSAFATIGAESPRFHRMIKSISYLFVFGVCCGFILIPLWIYFCGVR